MENVLRVSGLPIKKRNIEKVAIFGDSVLLKNNKILLYKFTISVLLIYTKLYQILSNTKILSIPLKSFFILFFLKPSSKNISSTAFA